MKISFVIPFYNRSNVIARTLDSILSQKGLEDFEFEIIIVDDGSSKSEISKCRSIALEYPGTSVIELGENRGAPSARNLGLMVTTGDYICFLDSDDELMPSFVYKSLQHISLSGWTCTSFVKKGRFRSIRRGLTTCGIVKSVGDLLFVSNISMPTSCNLFSKHVLRGILWEEDLRKFQDWDFVLRMNNSGFSPFFLSEPLVRMYTDSGGRISSINTEALFYEFFHRHVANLSASAVAGVYFWRLSEMRARSGMLIGAVVAVRKGFGVFPAFSILRQITKVHFIFFYAFVRRIRSTG